MYIYRKYAYAAETDKWYHDWMCDNKNKNINNNINGGKMTGPVSQISVLS